MFLGVATPENGSETVTTKAFRNYEGCWLGGSHHLKSYEHDPYGYALLFQSYKCRGKTSIVCFVWFWV